MRRDGLGLWMTNDSDKIRLKTLATVSLVFRTIVFISWRKVLEEMFSTVYVRLIRLARKNRDENGG